ncbi:uncharacterized protein LOC127790946 [Diospyros lotus]|uniref:uncharacterized protein LOC127790946 n=1 Tax=Diospyros lotus TaxID=55363 RepID=UPI00224E4004|nr:uncharacterized protein LOC127790946 [Diospyros lotus]
MSTLAEWPRPDCKLGGLCSLQLWAPYCSMGVAIKGPQLRFRKPLKSAVQSPSPLSSFPTAVAFATGYQLLLTGATSEGHCDIAIIAHNRVPYHRHHPATLATASLPPSGLTCHCHRPTLEWCGVVAVVPKIVRGPHSVKVSYIVLYVEELLIRTIFQMNQHLLKMLLDRNPSKEMNLKIWTNTKGKKKIL